MRGRLGWTSLVIAGATFGCGDRGVGGDAGVRPPGAQLSEQLTNGRSPQGGPETTEALESASYRVSQCDAAGPAREGDDGRLRRRAGSERWGGSRCRRRRRRRTAAGASRRSSTPTSRPTRRRSRGGTEPRATRCAPRCCRPRPGPPSESPGDDAVGAGRIGACDDGRYLLWAGRWGREPLRLPHEELDVPEREHDARGDHARAPQLGRHGQRLRLQRRHAAVLGLARDHEHGLPHHAATASARSTSAT